MSYNKYKTRNSGRFNKPGNFISTGEVLPGSVGGAGQRSNNMLPRTDLAAANYGAHSHAVQEQYGGADQSTGEAQAQYFGESVQPPMPPPPSADDMLKSDDVEMKADPNAEEDANGAGQDTRPRWWKGKMVGVKKLSNKERRRRQNETLRRLLTPKNALMVLNEMMPNDQIGAQFKVEAVPGEGHFKPGRPETYCAELALHGDYFKGLGENKIAARNAAAEQAVRNLIIRRLNKAANSDGATSEGGDGEEEALPMIQLASFALHKLFAEWECEGYKVPALRPQVMEEGHDTSSEGSYPRSKKRSAVADAGAGAGADAGAGAGATRPPVAKKPRVLPLNAAAMHPCMLLTYMRPGIEYRELAVEGDKPQNTVFTFGADVDGTTYVGKASNKKEARRAAARSACQEVFGVMFDESPTATTAVLPMSH